MSAIFFALRLRLALLLALACLSSAPAAFASGVAFAPVLPGHALQFPQDFGAHPDYRTEWWYITGWLKTEAGKDVGFQVTFFRSRTEHAPGNPSRFAPKQLVIAHAALSDPQAGKLLHDQKSAREGFGLAWAKTGNTDVRLDDWTLVRAGDGRYQARIAGKDFSLSLDFTPTQALMLQGEGGYSRKGPRTEQASYYYSEPQLKVAGSISRQGKSEKVGGQAWLDHEWSSTVLDERAAGWDWVGANLADGGALMMFRIRAKDGSQLWAHGALREPDGRVTHFAPEEIRVDTQRQWRSPRTGASYPVAVTFHTGAIAWKLTPLQDDQELDSRVSTGSVYWEGAVRLERDGKPAGQGYLELTGYHKALKL